MLRISVKRRMKTFFFEFLVSAFLLMRVLKIREKIQAENTSDNFIFDIFLLIWKTMVTGEKYCSIL